MRRLFLLAVGGAVGYVLGTRAGRQRYDQIVDLTTKAWQQTGLDEKTREVADQASMTARQAGDWVASTTSDKLSAARRDMADSTAGSPAGSPAGSTNETTYPGTATYHETQTTYPSSSP
jgi:hypothetical protein